MCYYYFIISNVINKKYNKGLVTVYQYLECSYKHVDNVLINVHHPIRIILIWR